MPEPRQHSAVFSLVAGNIAGFSGTTAIPLWLAASQARGAIAGVVASGEIALVGIGTLGAAAMGGRIGARPLCLGAAGVAVAGNLFAMLGPDAAFVAGRLLSGLATGVILATATALAAQRADAQKTLATMQIGLACFAALFYLALPPLVEIVGAAAIFGAVAATVLAAFIAMAAGLYGEVGRAAAGFRPIPRAVWMLIGLAAVFVGQSMAWNSLFSLGAAKGFDMQLVGRIMAVCAFVMMVGPVLSRLLGDRAGLRVPVLGFSLVLAADALLIAHTQGLWLFAAASALLVLLPGFGLPYVIARAGALGDARHAGAAPAFLMLGSAIGPVFAAPLVAGADWTAFGLVAGGVCLLGALLMGTGKDHT
ncbi:MFS transporter [Sphingosinicella soli]|uniref:Putative MFS family arabinose efflux permease n=1 Tax=Sphingosinicella soli TaxID=333708 RepID=A0A7W7B2X1_9SPHN|nr:MFS transporter [Sphingosinicella soli]MBB4633041.1 putative MFS family arabinose efflux permease [Sphingosinicella soli]